MCRFVYMSEADVHCSWTVRKLKKLSAMTDYPVDYYKDDCESFHFDWPTVFI